MSASLDEILAAYEAMSKGQYDAVPAILADHSSDDRTVAALLTTARGVVLERAGDAIGAAQCFESAYASRAPLAPVLRPCGRHFKRIGDYERAFLCFTLLEHIEPQSILEFFEDLPPDELLRYAPKLVKRLFQGRQPWHFRITEFKRVLVDRFGPEGGALMFAQMAGRAPGWQVTHAPLRPLRAAARAASTFEVLSPAADVPQPEVPVFGAPQGPEHVWRSREIFLSVLDDVVVSSTSNLLLAGDAALLDVQDGEPEKVADDVDIDPIVVAADGDELTLLLDAGAAAEAVFDEAFTLVGVHTANFGHWLLEYLTRLLPCLDRPGFAGVTLLVDRQMPRQHMEALRWLVGPEHPVHVLEPSQAVRVRRLWTCSRCVYIPIHPTPLAPSAQDLMVVDGGAFAGLWAGVEDRLRAVPPGSAKRIFLARQGSQHRAMVNKRAVERWFADHGFEIHDFGRLGFAEQLALIRGADVVVGPSGSSLMMTFFARPGTRVGILNNPFLQDHEWYAAVTQSLGQRLSILTGTVAERDPYYDYRAAYAIDVDTLAPFLDDLVAS